MDQLYEYFRELSEGRLDITKTVEYQFLLRLQDLETPISLNQFAKELNMTSIVSHFINLMTKGGLLNQSPEGLDSNFNQQLHPKGTTSETQVKSTSSTSQPSMSPPKKETFPSETQQTSPISGTSLSAPQTNPSSGKKIPPPPSARSSMPSGPPGPTSSGGPSSPGSKPSSMSSVPGPKAGGPQTPKSYETHQNMTSGPPVPKSNTSIPPKPNAGPPKPSAGPPKPTAGLSTPGSQPKSGSSEDEELPPGMQEKLNQERAKTGSKKINQQDDDDLDHAFDGLGSLEQDLEDN